MKNDIKDLKIGNGIDAVYETVYADIIIPYNIKDEIKNYLLKHYFTIDDHQICDANFEKNNWDITCSFDEYKSLCQIHMYFLIIMIYSIVELSLVE